MTKTTEFKRGVKPDHAKYRKKDHKFRGFSSKFNPMTMIIPKEFDNTEHIIDRAPDQGRVPTCASHSGHNGWAESAALSFTSRLFLDKNPKVNGTWLNFSRLWLDNQAKYIDPWPETVPGDDQGTDIRSILKVMTWGFVSEETVPYSDINTKLELSEKQRMKIVNEQQIYQLKDYSTCLRNGSSGWKADIDLIKRSIMQSGTCLIGVELPKGFYDIGNSGIVPTSSGSAGGIHAYHAMTLTGFTVVNGTKMLRGINSWGTSWGDRGSFLWSEDHFWHYCFSAWSMSTIKINHGLHNKYIASLKNAN